MYIVRCGHTPELYSYIVDDEEMRIADSAATAKTFHDLRKAELIAQEFYYLYGIHTDVLYFDTDRTLN